MWPLLLNRFSSVQLCVIPWTVARQALLSMGFSRQEYWSGLPFPPPGVFPPQGSNPGTYTPWITAWSWGRVLSNSMKQRAMLCRSTQDDGSQWRVLTKCDPLEEGMAKHSSILASGTLCTAWKGRKAIECIINLSTLSEVSNLFP